MSEDEFVVEPIDPAFLERLSQIDSAEEEARERTLRAGLEDYDLEDEDFDVLAAQFGENDGPIYLPALPVLAIVGRPNVGKSALVNRILGRREAVVEDKPGVTRDRISYKAEWNERKFTLVDTGGWEPDAKGIDKSVALQAEIAVELADAVLFVVDAMVGPTTTDERVVKVAVVEVHAIPGQRADVFRELHEADIRTRREHGGEGLRSRLRHLRHAGPVGVRPDPRPQGQPGGDLHGLQRPGGSLRLSPRLAHQLCDEGGQQDRLLHGLGRARRHRGAQAPVRADDGGAQAGGLFCPQRHRGRRAFLGQ